MGGGGGGWAGLTCRAPVPGGQGEGPRPDPDAQPPGPERPTEDDGEKGNRGIHGGCWQVGILGREVPLPANATPLPFRPAPAPWAQHPTRGPWVPGRWLRTALQPWLQPEDTWLLEVRPHRPPVCTTQSLGFPGAQVKLGGDGNPISPSERQRD